MQAYCNLTQLVSSSIPSYFCADTSSTHTLLRESDAPYVTRTTYDANKLHVLLLNGQSIHAIDTLKSYWRPKRYTQTSLADSLSHHVQALSKCLFLSSMGTFMSSQ